MEETTRLGFPSLRRTTAVWVKSWDTSVYAGLRRFHHGKGFDPESQDLAHHLSHPIYELSSEVELLFAHGKSINMNKVRFGLINIKWITRMLQQMTMIHSARRTLIVAHLARITVSKTH
jgi:hypothetical protein